MGVYVRQADGSMHWDESKADPNPNGGSVVDPSGTVIAGANRQSGSTGPGGNGVAGSQSNPNGTYQAGPPSNSALGDLADASSQFNYDQLAERTRQFNATLDWQKQMWANQGLPMLEIARRAQALAETEFLSQRQLAQANLGLNYLSEAAKLGGPSDYFQSVAFNRGAQQQGQVPAFLSALKNNTGLASFTAPGGTAPTVQSMDTLAASLTGAGGGTTPGAQDSALSAIGQIGTRGAQALAPQALEQMSPDEMGLLTSGLRASGFSVPDFLSIYRQSRVGQQSAQAA